ncbi:pilus assembly protein TadG-related protein [Pseudomonas koreensis]|uniref:pilus assembly protein TadG-related protein n=1 Tax=Pseudomonas koreensis TaxID=198620 RepID=UPI00207738B8|nr:pilus assembly protein TadG-related protein [Pseudomonas koreensis]MCM8739868.1 pilus assembly protein TadG-related protein [Pseudomonas koreensis]
MSPRSQFNGPARQHGAIGLMAALTLGLALVCMVLVVDSGRLYMEQRRLQRVVDVAALEAISRGGDCLTGASANGYATASAARNSFIVAQGTTLTVTCGTVQTGANNLRSFAADATKKQAISVVATRVVTTSVAAALYALFSPGSVSSTTRLSATAVGASAILPPQAQLTIGTTALTVDASKSAALNTLIGQMLGGSLNLSVAGWQGLVDTNINLLSYLNQLAVDVNVDAGNYTQLLSKNIQIGQLIDTAITVLTKGGTTTSVAVSGLLGLKGAVGSTSVALGQLLQLQTGATSAALNANLQVFQLIEAVVQVANSQNALVATVPLSIPGLVNGSVKTKVIQPPQLSAVGNPALAKADPMGANRIYVKTAQVRTMISLNLPVLSSVAGLASAIVSTPLVGGLTDTLNNVLHLNIAGALNSVFCTLGGTCQRTDLKILPTSTIDILLEAAAADSHVTDYSCTSDATKTLTTQTNSSVVKLKVGKIDATNAFSSSADVTVQPLALIDVGVITCTIPLLGLGSATCDPNSRKPFYGGGLGVMVDTSVASMQSIHTYNQPPEIKQTPQTYSFGTQGLVNSLKGTLSGVQVQAYKPTGSSLLGGLLSTTADVLASVNSTLGVVIDNLLSPVLDPILDGLLANLGITLNKVDVGANLSCRPPGQPMLVI